MQFVNLTTMMLVFSTIAAFSSGILLDMVALNNQKFRKAESAYKMAKKQKERKQAKHLDARETKRFFQLVLQQLNE